MGNMRSMKRAMTKHRRDNPPPPETIVQVAIKRNGKVYTGGQRGHYHLRSSLDPNIEDATKTVPGDIDGFLTSTGRFVDRKEATKVAYHGRQIRSAGRELLSSDLDW